MDATTEAGREAVLGYGYSQVPVVVTPDGDHWYGFDPFKLGQLAEGGH